MGETGPCGPDSEIFIDKGASYGEDGGPKHGGEQRFVELWNLVFMQFNRDAEGTLTELPRKNIDTGAGVERILPVLQGYDSMFDTELFVPIIDAAASVIGTGYGDRRAHRRLAARPGRPRTGHDDAGGRRGPAVQRGPRLRAAPHRPPRRDGGPPPRGGQAHRPHPRARRPPRCWARPGRRWSASTTSSSTWWPARRRASTAPCGPGSGRLEEAFATGAKVLPGDVAFTLHDTHGFPVELTEELARDAGVEVDRAGFDAAMREQRERARAAAKSTRAGDEAAYRVPARERGPDRLRRAGPGELRVARPGAGRARGHGGRRRRRRSRSSWTAPPSTPRAVARWATPAPSSPSRASPTSTTPCTPCPA